MKYLIASLVAMLAVAGCSLDGDRPLDKLARLETHYHWTYSGRTAATDFIFRVLSVDGRPVPEGIDTMRLKPGTHSLIVSCQNRAVTGSNPETVRLNPQLETGIRYIPGQGEDENACAPVIVNSKAPFGKRDTPAAHDGVFAHD